jgi:hypothetical protein
MMELVGKQNWYLTPASRFWLVGSPRLTRVPMWPVQEGDLLVILGDMFEASAQVKATTTRAIRGNKVLVFGTEETALNNAAALGLWGVGQEALWWRDAGLVGYSPTSIRITTEEVDVTMSYRPEDVLGGVNVYGYDAGEYNPVGIRVGPEPIRLADLLKGRMDKVRGN